jgi:death on curing protein
VTEYLSVRQVLRIHALQIDEFGGSAGVRDRGALESALARPQMTFDGEDLYRDLADKSAALLHSLVQNHPFLDGNKRVGAMAMELFVLANEYELRASDSELEELVLAIAGGELAAEAIAIWIRQRLRALAP